MYKELYMEKSKVIVWLRQETVIVIGKKEKNL